MKKLLSIVLAALMLVGMLTSCAKPANDTKTAADGQASDQAETSGLVGTYKCTHAIFGDEEMSEQDMEQLGTISLQLAADGTGKLNVFNEEEHSLTWDDKTITVMYDDESSSSEYTIGENGSLSFTDDDSSLTFAKVSDEIIELNEKPTDPLEAAANLSQDMPGTYTLYSMKSDGETIDWDDLRYMGYQGMKATVELNEDGTGRIDIFGEEHDLTWDDSGIQIEDENLAYSLSDHVLTFDFYESEMNFVKTSDSVG